MEDSSSVLKNRITGYSNINSLKQENKRFHESENPEAVSKNTLSDLISGTRNKLNNNKHLQSNTSLAFSSNSSHMKNETNQHYRTMQDSRAKPPQEQQVIH